MSEWNDIAVIAPPHDIDLATVPALRVQVDALIARGVRRVIINCQHVTFIDSTGMAFLLTRARTLFENDGMLSLVGASAQVLRFLQIARLVDVLHVSPADKPLVPALNPDASPVWSKSYSILPGVEHLGMYRHRVAELLEGVHMGRDESFDTALAVGEALSNAYDHANNAHGCTMTMAAYADRVVIEVCDSGCGYEIASGEEPPESRERGRGIRLMRMLVDSVDVSRRVDAPGTRVQLVKLI